MGIYSLEYERQKGVPMKKLLILTALVSLAGCATIVDGGEQNVNFVPSNSKDKVHATIITKEGAQTVKLPAVVHTKRSGADIIVAIDEEENKCYETTTQTVSSSINPLILGNVITGGFFGSTTDAASGAAWEYADTVIVYPSKKDSCK